MTNYILAIDQGTTGTTALLVGHDLRVHGRHTVDFHQHFPKPGWVEHNPEEIWVSVRQAILELLEATLLQVDGNVVLFQGARFGGDFDGVGLAFVRVLSYNERRGACSLYK